MYAYVNYMCMHALGLTGLIFTNIYYVAYNVGLMPMHDVKYH